jgi:hypothetical protein
VLQADSKIGDHFLIVYKHPERFGENSDLYERVENIIDIFRSRLPTKGIDYTITSLRDELWELRWDFLARQDNFKELFVSIHESAVKEIIDHRYNFSRLATVQSNALQLYATILLSITELLPGDIEIPVTTISELRGAYSSLKILQQIVPNETESLLNWIESSLDFECCLIIVSLALSKELVFDNNNLDELALKLKDTITKYAFYTAILHYWTPGDEDESQYTRNVKILLANHELENGIVNTYNIDDFRNLMS